MLRSLTVTQTTYFKHIDSNHVDRDFKLILSHVVGLIFPVQVCIWPFHLGDTASYLNLLSYQVRQAEPLTFITLGSIFQRPFFGGYGSVFWT